MCPLAPIVCLLSGDSVNAAVEGGTCASFLEFIQSIICLWNGPCIPLLKDTRIGRWISKVIIPIRSAKADEIVFSSYFTFTYFKLCDEQFGSFHYCALDHCFCVTERSSHATCGISEQAFWWFLTRHTYVTPWPCLWWFILHQLIEGGFIKLCRWAAVSFRCFGASLELTETAAPVIDILANLFCADDLPSGSEPFKWG